MEKNKRIGRTVIIIVLLLIFVRDIYGEEYAGAEIGYGVEAEEIEPAAVPVNGHEALWEFIGRKLEEAAEELLINPYGILEVPEKYTYISAYAEIIVEEEKAFRKRKEGNSSYVPCSYELIHLDNDGIPELSLGQRGYWVTVFTWKEGGSHEITEEVYQACQIEGDYKRIEGEMDEKKDAAAILGELYAPLWKKQFNGGKYQAISDNLLLGGPKADQEKIRLRPGYEESGVFEGVYLSDAKAKIDNILIELMNRGGKLSEENSRLFSDYALQQLKAADWSALGEKWSRRKEKGEAANYDCFCMPNLLWADSGYEFVYVYEDETKVSDGQGEITWIKLVVSETGMIQGFVTREEKRAKDNPWLDAGLEGDSWFVDAYTESVLTEGKPEEGKILVVSPKIQEAFDMLPVWASASSIQSTEDVSPTASLQSEEGYMDVSLLAKQAGENLLAGFDSSIGVEVISGKGAEILSHNWLASPYYDVWYYPAYSMENALAFVYYIYPDFEKMHTPVGEALILYTLVNKESKEVSFLETTVVFLTQEDYQAKREKLGTQFLFMKGAPKEQSFTQDTGLAVGNSRLRWKGSWGEEELLPYGEYVYQTRVGQHVLIETNWEEEGREYLEEGWEPENYDIYYCTQNDWKGKVHFRYYYHWRKEGVPFRQTLGMDVWISQEGVTATRGEWLFTGIGEEAEVSQEAERLPQFFLKDIAPYLQVDWTLDELLFFQDSEIQPNGSGWGWSFSLADINFDAVPEMLVTFPYWTGGNSLYVYRIEGEQVVPYFATYGTRGGIVSDFDPEEISSYLNIDLLGIYVNEAGEYRYLSTDDNLHGGDIRGDMGGFSLYETRPESGAMPKKILEVIYVYPGEYMELYFKGEKVYGKAALGELLEEYMEGWEPVEWSYTTAKTGFDRAEGEEERKAKLPQLYEDFKGMVSK